jgi:hypothetical protein
MGGGSATIIDGGENLTFLDQATAGGSFPHDETEPPYGPRLDFGWRV